jgi:uncharacterized protein (TIGR03086 family)
MDATSAMQQTNQLVTGLIAALTPEHREMATPCDEWTVHDLVGHMCGGAHMVVGGMQGQAPPAEMPDFLAEGPAAGWAAAAGHLAEAATPAALGAKHKMPFGEVPGEGAVAVITADHLVHAWDLAQATNQDLQMTDQLAEFALRIWQPVVPAEGRTGDGFKTAVVVADGASALDALVAYTGRNP